MRVLFFAPVFNQVRELPLSDVTRGFRAFRLDRGGFRPA